MSQTTHRHSPRASLRQRRLGWTLGLLLPLASALALPAQAAGPAPDGKGGGVMDKVQARAVTGAAAAQILYHGGPVMTASTGVNVYVIWYGNWAGNTATTVLPEFLSHLGGSPYWHINTTYYDAAGQHISDTVTLAGQTTDNYSKGTSLSDAKVWAVVKAAIQSKRLPKDPNGLYFVLTSKDVNETSGFCTQYCGWHTHATLGTQDIKYSFVGDASRCLSACAAQSTGPNGNAGADGMASVIAHELEEAASDPDLNAWYFASGSENADQCAWTFGTQYTAPNGAKANMNINGHDYLIQRNWVQAAAGYCGLTI